MKLHLVKDRMGALRPADEHAEEALKGIKAGEYLKVELTRPRNIKFHRLFFALLTVVHHNLPEELELKYPTVERLLWEIKLQTGQFDLGESLSGKPYYIPHSISFAKMDEDSFEKFFTEAIGICRKYFLSGVSERELLDSVDTELSKYS